MMRDIVIRMGADSAASSGLSSVVVTVMNVVCLEDIESCVVFFLSTGHYDVTVLRSRRTYASVCVCGENRVVVCVM
jgi:hypothetical protein